MNPELNSPNDNSIEKVEKKDNAISAAFGGLSTREKIMVYALAVIAVVAGLGFFVFVPALDNISTLNEEVDSLRAQKMEYEMQINNIESYKQLYEESKASLDKYITFFYPVMQPETIDKTITALIKQAGMRPQSLTLSPLEEVTVSLFSPEGEAVMMEDPNVELDPSEATEPDEGEIIEGEESSGISSLGRTTFAYTIDVVALAEQEQLFGLIDAVAKMTSLELISYDITPPQEEIVNPGDILVGTPTQSQEDGSISMQFKMYVYIDAALPPATAADSEQ